MLSNSDLWGLLIKRIRDKASYQVESNILMLCMSKKLCLKSYRLFLPLALIMLHVCIKSTWSLLAEKLILIKKTFGLLISRPKSGINLNSNLRIFTQQRGFTQSTQSMITRLWALVGATVSMHILMKCIYLTWLHFWINLKMQSRKFMWLGLISQRGHLQQDGDMQPLHIRGNSIYLVAEMNRIYVMSMSLILFWTNGLKFRSQILSPNLDADIQQYLLAGPSSCLEALMEISSMMWIYWAWRRKTTQLQSLSQLCQRITSL